MKKIFLLFLFVGINLLLHAQVYKTVNVTAGGLYAALTTTELTTVTNLTVAGVIDARDFKIMRDSMPVLSILDIRGAKIAAYTGTKGTYLPTSILYDSNCIPKYSFNFYSKNVGKTTLTSIFLPLSITEIKEYAFRGCTNLISVSMPLSLTIINSYVFKDCTNLTSISVTPSVYLIGDYSFENCTSLLSIYLPPSVTNIGVEAFNNCSGFINVDSNNTNYSSVDGILYNKNQTNLYRCPISKMGSFSIPSTVQFIWQNAFANCSKLTSIKIPSSVIEIMKYAFLYCTGLCGKMDIPQSVTSIGQSAFGGCTNLSSLIIPPSPSIYIHDAAFASCSGLTYIYTKSSTPPDLSSISNVFQNVDTNTCILYVPVGSKTLYQSAIQWKDFKNIIERTTAIWNGTVDGTWENPANWSTGIVPDSLTDVYINAGSPPLVVNSNAACFSLNQASGTTLTVNTGYNITITGH